MNNIFDDKNAVKSNWVKFNKEGEDNIYGTLISVRSVKSNLPGQEGQMQNIYEIKAEGGSFHDLDENKAMIKEPVKITKGDVWNVGGGKSIDTQMRNVKIGTKIGIKFTELIPSQTKGYAPAKIRKVFVAKNEHGMPLMDQEWLDEQEQGKYQDDNFNK